MKLQDIWNELNEQGYGSDKGSIHSYLPVYEEILEPYRNVDGNVLEIGIFRGDSLRMWEKYFTKAKVHGIDCSETPINGMADLRPMIAEGAHHIHIMDATSEADIYNSFRGMVFQVIIDDGNHNVFSQLKSYELLSKHLSDTGIYIIEDIERIDETRELFEKIDGSKKVEIIDRRHINGRFDNVLVLITDK